MREIKFRAWDETRGVMIGSDYPNNWDNNNDEWWADENYMRLTSIEDFKDIPKIHLMQYTGLKDKNGVEIYEGDIVRIEKYLTRDGKNYYSHTGKVDFKNGMFLIVNDYPTNVISFATEVIGNIYENKELLDG